MTGGPLQDVRVVDLTTDAGEIAGRVLADLGAEVLKIEPPTGVAARARGPHAEGHGSLFWAAYGRGKRSIVLDRATQDGAALLDALLARADIVVASEAAGDACVRHPHLIWAAITAYGTTGPAAERPATDLTIEAAGGLLAMQGDGDRPPVPVGYPQAFLHAGAQAAADVLIALQERRRSGLGQELDVSAQGAMAWTLMNAFGWAMLLGSNVPGSCELRHESLELVPGIEPPMPRYPVWETADGHAIVTLQLPLIGERTIQKLVEWAAAQDALSADLAARSWLTWRDDLRAGDLSRADADRMIAELQAFVATTTNQQIQAFAVSEAVTIAAIHTVDAVLADPQFDARGYWGSSRGLRHPHEWVKFATTPLAPVRPAPELGADNNLVESILTEPARPRSTSAVRDPGSDSGRAAGSLDGLKVADFAWVGVGPLISKACGDHGAEVVHIESNAKLDVLRKLPPMADGEPGVNRSQFFAMMNTSKRGLALNLATPEGHEVARELIDWADVVVESFTPGTMGRLGLDYATVSAEHPDLVMLSTCLRGQTGPEKSFAGFGNQGAAVSGLLAVTGWPDRAPCGPWGAYTDFISPRFGVAALMAALHHRDRTGHGQHLDLAQAEVGAQFLEPKLLQAQCEDLSMAPVGHASDTAAPHGVFETADGRHLAIATETVDQWRALVDAAGLDSFRDDRFDDLGARQDVKAAVEAELARWCADHSAESAAALLSTAGVPTAVVTFPSELVGDEQLAHREFFAIVDHPEIGPTPMEGHATRFSATPPSIRHPAPQLGQHTDEILTDILGYSSDHITSLRKAGVLD